MLRKIYASGSDGDRNYFRRFYLFGLNCSFPAVYSLTGKGDEHAEPSENGRRRKEQSHNRRRAEKDAVRLVRKQIRNS
jgi:hypothetical protein